MKEKLDHALEEAYHAFKGGNKDKLKVWTIEVIKLEQQCNAFDLLVPLVKNVQSNVKTIIKSDECPDNLSSAVASIVYFAANYGMPAFQRFTAQIGFKYGQKYVDRIQQKHKGVDEDVYASLTYNPSKDEIKERSKDLSSLSKKRAKNEQRLLKESGAALVSTITDIPSSIANMAAKKERPKKKGSKKNPKVKSSRKSSKVISKDSDSDDDSEYSESDSEYSEDDSEYSSEEGSESSDSDESESSDSEKEKKKAKKAKKEAKDKKEAMAKKESKKAKKTKPMNESDSEIPPEPNQEPEQTVNTAAEKPIEENPNPSSAAQAPVDKTAEVAKEETQS